MLATDPLSLVFLGCAVFAGAFLVITTALGHGPHAGHVGHTGHVGHVGHVGHAGHVGHVGHVAQAGAHAPNANAAAHAQTSPHATSSEASVALAPASPLTALTHMLESALNVYGVLTFLLIFGVLGYLLRNVANLGDIFSLLAAIVVGLGCALAVSALLTRIFLAAGGGELTSENSRLEGRLGEVSMTIHGTGIGEVIYTGAAGGRQSVGARSMDGTTIAEGTEVVVLGYRDGIASVQTWEAFMASVRAGNAPMLESIEGQL